eukprot:GILK01001237.1.p1 GENE.GILK01001237.1~~GILK01001237.1.p1  ORF type:complete len:891 (-),score=100.70 GILK01001237.1:100-2772(-)
MALGRRPLCLLLCAAFFVLGTQAHKLKQEETLMFDGPRHAVRVAPHTSHAAAESTAHTRQPVMLEMTAPPARYLKRQRLAKRLVESRFAQKDPSQSALAGQDYDINDLDAHSRSALKHIQDRVNKYDKQNAALALSLATKAANANVSLEDIDPSLLQCTESTCNGRGSCFEGKCSCEDGWKGPYCGQPKCQSECVKSLNSEVVAQYNVPCGQPYVCNCKQGWTGTFCEEAICNLPCRNGAVCIEPNVCSCTPGWKGPLCDVDNTTITREQILERLDTMNLTVRGVSNTTIKQIETVIPLAVEEEAIRDGDLPNTVFNGSAVSNGSIDAKTMDAATSVDGIDPLASVVKPSDYSQPSNKSSSSSTPVNAQNSSSPANRTQSSNEPADNSKYNLPIVNGIDPTTLSAADYEKLYVIYKNLKNTMYPAPNDVVRSCVCRSQFSDPFNCSNIGCQQYNVSSDCCAGARSQQCLWSSATDGKATPTVSLLNTTVTSCLPASAVNNTPAILSKPVIKFVLPDLTLANNFTFPGKFGCSRAAVPPDAMNTDPFQISWAGASFATNVKSLIVAVVAKSEDFKVGQDQNIQWLVGGIDPKLANGLKPDSLPFGAIAYTQGNRNGFEAFCFPDRPSSTLGVRVLIYGRSDANPPLSLPTRHLDLLYEIEHSSNTTAYGEVFGWFDGTSPCNKSVSSPPANITYTAPITLASPKTNAAPLDPLCERLNSTAFNSSNQLNTTMNAPDSVRISGTGSGWMPTLANGTNSSSSTAAPSASGASTAAPAARQEKAINNTNWVQVNLFGQYQIGAIALQGVARKSPSQDDSSYFSKVDLTASNDTSCQSSYVPAGSFTFSSYNLTRTNFTTSVIANCVRVNPKAYVGSAPLLKFELYGKAVPKNSN